MSDNNGQSGRNWQPVKGPLGDWHVADIGADSSKGKLQDSSNSSNTQNPEPAAEPKVWEIHI